MALYSTSMDEQAVEHCFFELHEICFWAMKDTIALVGDRRDYLPNQHHKNHTRTTSNEIGIKDHKNEYH